MSRAKAPIFLDVKVLVNRYLVGRYLVQYS
jgi:hypothetical protein